MARRRKSLVRTIYKVMALQLVLGLLAVIVIEIVVIGVMNFRNRIRPDTVLVVDVRGSVAEEAPRGFWEEVTRGRVKVMSDFLEAIDRAARDSRINGLVLRVGGGGDEHGQAPGASREDSRVQPVRKIQRCLP